MNKFIVIICGYLIPHKFKIDLDSQDPYGNYFWRCERCPRVRQPKVSRWG